MNQKVKRRRLAGKVQNLVLKEMLRQAQLEGTDSYRPKLRALRNELLNRLGIHKVTLDLKLHNRLEFKVSELVVAADLLEVGVETLIHKQESVL